MEVNPPSDLIAFIDQGLMFLIKFISSLSSDTYPARHIRKVPPSCTHIHGVISYWDKADKSGHNGWLQIIGKCHRGYYFHPAPEKEGRERVRRCSEVMLTLLHSPSHYLFDGTSLFNPRGAECNHSQLLSTTTLISLSVPPPYPLHLGSHNHKEAWQVCGHIHLHRQSVLPLLA